MQKISLSLAILTSVLVIIFLMQPIAQVAVVKANPISHPSIYVDSPEHYKVGRVYQETSVDIIAQIYRGFEQYGFSNPISAFYSLDGNSNNSLTLSYDTYNVIYTATGKMANLTDGYHNLRIFAFDSNGKGLSTSTTFLVNTTFAYPTFLLSPSNITYSKNEVPLTYFFEKTNDNSILTIYYKIDNISNSLAIRGNTTLTDLSEGQHAITIRAITGFSLYSEQTVYFTIKTTKSEQPLATSNLTIALLIATIATIAGASLAVLAYKRSKKVSDSYD
jgi:hypothetical protein